MIRTLAVATPAASQLLISDADAKAELALTNANDDVWLAAAIAQASAAIGAYCGRSEGFGAAQFVDTWRAVRPGRTVEALLLSRDLNIEIVSVLEDGTTLASADYLLDGSMLRRLASDTPTAWRASKIVATYTAGYDLPADAPADLARCCLDLCVRAYNARGRDPGLRSERILDVIAQSWDTPGGDGFKGGLPRDVADRLDPYIRYVAA